MKVKGINSSSQKTDDLIKQAFVELMNEKKELKKITVTELVKKASITRGSFYTHYDNIYDVANVYQEETLDFLTNEENNLYTISDIYSYLDNTIEKLKQNEDVYRMLLSSNEPLLFLNKLRKISVEKIYHCLKINGYNYKDLELDVTFYVDGTLLQLLKYFRENNYYSLDEINQKAKKWFQKIFN